MGVPSRAEASSPLANTTSASSASERKNGVGPVSGLLLPPPPSASRIAASGVRAAQSLDWKLPRQVNVSPSAPGKLGLAPQASTVANGSAVVSRQSLPRGGGEAQPAVDV